LASAHARPVLYSISDAHREHRLLLEDAANSDRLSSFLPLSIGSDKALALFTSDSCRPVHLAFRCVDQSGETIWRRQSTSGLEVLAGSIDGACVQAAGSLESDGIVVAKPGVVLIARPVRSALSSGNSVVNAAEKTRHLASTLVLLRGTGMAQRYEVAAEDPNRDSLSDGRTSSSKMVGVRVSVLQSTSTAETRFNVECPLDDELLEVQVLSLDGRILHQWSGAELSTQRTFSWSASNIVASGTYAVRAIAKKSSHVASFQRIH